MRSVNAVVEGMPREYAMRLSEPNVPVYAVVLPLIVRHRPRPGHPLRGCLDVYVLVQLRASSAVFADSLVACGGVIWLRERAAQENFRSRHHAAARFFTLGGKCRHYRMSPNPESIASLGRACNMHRN